jgi:hypothetical protein
MLKKFEFCEILRKNALIRFYLVPWKDLLDLKLKTVVGLFFMQTILIFFSYTFSRTQVSNDLCHCDSFHQYCSLMSFYFLGCFKLTFSPLSFKKKKRWKSLFYCLVMVVSISNVLEWESELVCLDILLELFFVQK